MIKRTLYFGNPTYLKTKDEQLVIEMHDSGETKTHAVVGRRLRKNIFSSNRRMN
jgi:hypothetical protein